MDMPKLFKSTAEPVLILLTGMLFATAAMSISIWPLPSYYSSGDKVLWIAENVQFTYNAVNSTVLFHLALYSRVCSADKPSVLRQAVLFTGI